jgi:hypothetical protein
LGQWPKIFQQKFEAPIHPSAAACFRAPARHDAANGARRWDGPGHGPGARRMATAVATCHRPYRRAKRLGPAGRQPNGLVGEGGGGRAGLSEALFKNVPVSAWWTWKRGLVQTCSTVSYVLDEIPRADCISIWAVGHKQKTQALLLFSEEKGLLVGPRSCAHVVPTLV